MQDTGHVVIDHPLTGYPNAIHKITSPKKYLMCYKNTLEWMNKQNKRLILRGGQPFGLKLKKNIIKPPPIDF